MLKLNVGCGPVHLPGYLGVDLYADCADRRDDARTLATFADGSVDEVYASHLLEHLGRFGGQLAVNTWFRVLRSGGELRVILPDIAYSIRRWLSAYDAHRDPYGFKSQCLWGVQSDPGQYHTWGYTEESLRFTVRGAGFQGIEIERVPGWDDEEQRWHEGSCLDLRAVKP